MKILIRRFNKSKDLPKLIEYGRQLVSQHPWLGPFNEREFVQNLLNKSSKDTAIIFIAEIERHQIVGYGVAEVKEEPFLHACKPNIIY